MSKDAKARYKAKIRTIRVDLYLKDQDIKDELDRKVASGTPVAAYIKQLIRDNMDR